MKATIWTLLKWIACLTDAENILLYLFMCLFVCACCDLKWSFMSFTIVSSRLICLFLRPQSLDHRPSNAFICNIHWRRLTNAIEWRRLLPTNRHINVKCLVPKRHNKQFNRQLASHMNDVQIWSCTLCSVYVFMQLVFVGPISTICLLTTLFNFSRSQIKQKNE